MIDSRDYSAMTGGSPEEITLDVWSEDETTFIETVVLPSKFEVCWLCHGEGKHVNPAIDHNGVSADKFDDDPDFRDAYFSGVYDVPCNECHGKRVVKALDRKRCDPAHLKAYDEYKEQERMYAYEQMCEQRAGC